MAKADAGRRHLKWGALLDLEMTKNIFFHIKSIERHSANVDFTIDIIGRDRFCVSEFCLNFTVGADIAKLPIGLI